MHLLYNELSIFAEKTVLNTCDYSLSVLCIDFSSLPSSQRALNQNVLSVETQQSLVDQQPQRSVKCHSSAVIVYNYL